jgi:hypothetical protein
MDILINPDLIIAQCILVLKHPLYPINTYNYMSKIKIGGWQKIIKIKNSTHFLRL